LILLASETRAADGYYVVIFGAQQEVNRPQAAHSFATFVKVTSDGPATNDDRLESHTISWMPRSLDVRVLRRFPEPGTNLSLNESLRLARSLDARVVKFGPYSIDKELYDRAVRQIERLESGNVAYKAVDTRYSPTEVCNCIHAVSQVAGDEAPIAQTGWGASASAFIVQRFQPWIKDNTRKRHEWVSERLGLQQFEIANGDAGATERKSDR
jgi:hypothetical protein